MNSFLYIGQYSEGTTSNMRANQLFEILNSENAEVIDTHIPFFKTNKLFRSLGFRYKNGPLISNINKYIQKNIKREQYDLIWVDKGVYLSLKTMRILRQKTQNLVHFTPDPAFTYHQSSLFYKSLPFYDYFVTTKSFELEDYYKRVSPQKVLYATQGFDKLLHKRSNRDFSEKSGLVFIGHHEKSREAIIEVLLNHNIKVTLAGIKWEVFAKRHIDSKNLIYLGSGVYGEDYVKTIQQAKIAWGAISKWIPELHTTRTFEIPACGTALLTEANAETSKFFNPDEVIFYNDEEELVEKVKYYMEHTDELEILTQKGYDKVIAEGFDYYSILGRLLKTILK